MRNLVLYIAVSLDGKIAKPDGSVEWLEKIMNPEGTDYGYQDFYDSIDTTLMGHATYKAILGFDGAFPYAEKQNFVFTRQKNTPKSSEVTFVNSEVDSFIETLKAQEGGDIWLVGGGQFTSYLLNEGFVDAMHLFVMPMLLGEGISLFEGGLRETMLSLRDEHTYQNGVKALHYRVENRL